MVKQNMVVTVARHERPCHPLPPGKDLKIFSCQYPACRNFMWQNKYYIGATKYENIKILLSFIDFVMRLGNDDTILVKCLRCKMNIRFEFSDSETRSHNLFDLF